MRYNIWIPVVKRTDDGDIGLNIDDLGEGTSRIKFKNKIKIQRLSTEKRIEKYHTILLVQLQYYTVSIL